LRRSQGSRERFAATPEEERRAALHNRLNLLESPVAEMDFNRSPRSADDSSREAERKVEFINQPKAVSLTPARGGQYAGIGKGLGSSFEITGFGDAPRCARQLWSGII